jgi:hypothetical protein
MIYNNDPSSIIQYFGTRGLELEGPSKEPLAQLKIVSPIMFKSSNYLSRLFELLDDNLYVPYFYMIYSCVTNKPWIQNDDCATYVKLPVTVSQARKELYYSFITNTKLKYFLALPGFIELSSHVCDPSKLYDLTYIEDNDAFNDKQSSFYSIFRPIDSNETFSPEEMNVYVNKFQNLLHFQQLVYLCRSICTNYAKKLEYIRDAIHYSIYDFETHLECDETCDDDCDSDHFGLSPEHLARQAYINKILQL